MSIKIFRFFVLLSFFLSSFSYAATFNFSDYLFKSKSQNGFFIGLELVNNNANYYTNYYPELSEPKPEDEPYRNLSVPDGEYSLIYGARYYLKSKNVYLNRLGFGFKGWYSQQTNTVDRKYIGIPELGDILKINSTVETFGNEGQIYFDLLKFSSYKVNNAIGISLGAGYELKSYSDFKFGPDKRPFNLLSSNFKLNSIIYDASLYYTFANHLRVDVGYKITNYSTYRAFRAVYVNDTDAAEVKVLPENKYFYISTSFQF